MNKIILSITIALLAGVFAYPQKITETYYYQTNPNLGGDATIKKSTKEVKQEKAYVTFEINASKAGNYYVSFWLLPTKLKNETYSNYQVSVNGNILSEKICPKIGDWQSITLTDNKKIALNQGTNTISVIGDVPDVPNVEHVKISANIANAVISNTNYVNYKNDIAKANKKAALDNVASTYTFPDTITSEVKRINTYASQNNPPYNYGYSKQMLIKYTFYKTIYYSKGEQIYIETNGLGKYGHITEMFSIEHPELYSWNATSDANYHTLMNITIPETGFYIVKIRSDRNADTGLCDIDINGKYLYDNVPIFSIGVRYEQGTDQVYNTFTSNATGNPVIWIEGGPEFPGKMREYNDDYPKQGDYDWGVNARIKKKYPNTVYAVLLSTSSSYTPFSYCDLYIGCANSNITNIFKNLKSDDAIQSAPATGIYNCIAWSGGIYNDWCWPLSDFSSHNYSDALGAFDLFYGSERYDGCQKFTRVGANENNSVIDLWGIRHADGSIEYTHASVRNGADANIHGYDWESKPGSLMRTFHPRYSLNGTNYGEVVEHYIPINTSTKTLDQSIAEGTTTIEYADYNEEEKSIIKSHVKNIDRSVLEEFNELYAQWNNIWNNTPFSNPVQIADCDTYKKMKKLCSSDNSLLYEVFDKLGKGDYCAVKLIEDLSVTKNKAVLENVMSRNKNDIQVQTGAKIIRPIHTNAMLYVKSLLAKETALYSFDNAKQIANEDLSYSNFNDFAVSNSDKILNISFTIPEKSNVTLKILDLNGKEEYSHTLPSSASVNSHKVSVPIEKEGFYIVKLVINNRINAKKILVK